MAAGIIAPSLPEIASVFEHKRNPELLSKLLLTIPALFIALSAPFAGNYIDKRGRIKLLYLSLIVYAITGSSGLYLNNIYHILIGRAILGISIGTIMTITITLIGDYFTGQERIKFISYQTAFIGFAGVAFLTFGGVLANISWRLPFGIYLFSLLLIPLVFKLLYEPDIKHSIEKKKVIVSGSLTHILFITAFLIMILMYIIPTQLPFYLRSLGMIGNTMSGTGLAAQALGAVISSLLFTQLKSRISFPYMFSIAFIIMGIGYLITGLTHSFAVIHISVFIAGFGFGIMYSNNNLWLIQIAQPEMRGRIMGFLTTFYFIGQFLSPIVIEPIVKWSSLAFLFRFSAIVMVMIALIFLLLGKTLLKLDKS